MKKADRQKLQRIYAVLEIPGCHSGASTRTMCVKGAAGFAADITHALPEARMALYLAAVGESYEGEFDEVMEPLEAWHAKRVAESWAHPMDLTNTVEGSNE